MRNPQGYSQVVGDGVGPTSDPGLRSLGEQGECDTFTCAHTGKIVHVPVGANPEDIGGFCSQCGGLICKEAVGGPCIPWEKQMDDLEKAIERRRAVEKWF